MNSIPMTEVESPQIHSIGHDAESNTLAVRFFSYRGKKGPGATYHYKNVTADDFAAFRDSESLGKHFGQHIKPHAEKYPFTRIDDAPALTEAKA